MPNSIFRSQPLFIGQIFMCAGPAVLKRPHRRQGAAMAVGEAPNTQRHTGDRQQHQHNRRSNTTSSREKIKADAEQEPLSGDPTTRYAHQQRADPRARPLPQQRDTPTIETTHQQSGIPVAGPTQKQGEKKKRRAYPDLGEARGGHESATTYTFNTMALLSLIEWVLISTFILCVHTHHNALCEAKPTTLKCPSPGGGFENHMCSTNIRSNMGCGSHLNDITICLESRCFINVNLLNRWGISFLKGPTRGLGHTCL